MHVRVPKSFQHKTNSISTTSYTLITFLPGRLAKEMTKTFNLFFVILCCIVMIPNLTSFSKSSYILCISFYICTSILKTGINEIKKYRLDRKINKREVDVIRHENLTKIWREDINVGERVIIKKGEIIPVNTLVLGAYTEKGRGSGGCVPQIHIETSAIDGESALKLRSPLTAMGSTGALEPHEMAVLETIKVEYDPETQSGELAIEVQDPQMNAPVLQSIQIPITKKNVIPMGASIYTDATTIVLSLGGEQKKAKPSRIKGSIFINMISNISIYTMIAYLILLLISVVSACWFMVRSEWLLGSVAISITSDSMRTLVSNVLIFSSLIPLSLFVTLDGLRISYSIFIQSDTTMQSNETQTKCNTHGVLEDIGLISHVLSDKTGTLTLNQMTLKGFHLPGSSSLAIRDPKNLQALYQSMNVISILTVLLCHSVCMVNGEYIGTSQEEVCSLQYFRDNQIVLLSNQDGRVTIDIEGNILAAHVLGVLPFSPAIARMSVIVLVERKVFILTKGSDETVPNMCTLQVGGEYRTLTMAGTEISKESLQKISEDTTASSGLEEAAASEHRENIKKIIRVMENKSKTGKDYESLKGISLPIEFIMECEKLTEYIGTLYLEDTLQPDAAKTVRSITNKGTNLWMVTGDRKESAISCGILSGMAGGVRAISGAEMMRIVESEPELLKEKSLVLFRCTPEHKKEIAHILRRAGNIVLAVGDGENDIGMIEEADIGVCVCGPESSRTSLSADLVIPSFSALGRLVMHHGPIALNRLRNVFLFFIFKSVCVAVCQCIYGGFVGASGSMAPSSLFLIFFNSLLTSPLSVEMGLFRRACIRKSVFDSFLRGVLYGVASFCVVYSLFGSIDVISMDGELGGHSLVSCFFSMCLFISTVSYFIYSAESFVIYSFLALFVSMMFFILIIGMDIGFEAFASPAFYLCAIYMILAGMAVERVSAVLRKNHAERQSSDVWEEQTVRA
ncbi:phospholipid-transporting ATPase [Nematocida ausubeli]|nr:phospholipid-transporting ATPase [Nematocida ausubeli]